MSTKSAPLAEGTQQTYVTRFDGVRVLATEYRPVWLDGVAQGADTVRSLVSYVRTLYDSQEFKFAGSYGEDGFLEDYTASVRGQPLGNVVLITRNAAGQAQHVVVNYRPRSNMLLLSRLIGDHFAGTPYGKHFATSG